jgi:hypothetical protein
MSKTDVTKRYLLISAVLAACLVVGVGIAIALTRFRGATVAPQTAADGDIGSFSVTETMAETVTGADSESAPRPVLYGARARGHDGRTDAEELARIEGLIGRKFDAERFYWHIGDSLPSADAKKSVGKGRVPIISLGSGPYSWAEVASGAADSQLRTLFREIKAEGGLFLKAIIGFMNEPESKVGTLGSADEYRAAFQRVVTIAREEGLPNKWTTFLQSNTWETLNPTDWWPGDPYVDYMGVQGYGSNPNTCDTRQWRSFTATFQAPYAFALRHGKPMLIGEWGQREDRADPQRKAEWLRNAAVVMERNMPRIRVVSYYHSDGGGPCAYEDSWWIDTSPQALEAFAAMAQPSPALGGTSSRGGKG